MRNENFFQITLYISRAKEWHCHGMKIESKISLDGKEQTAIWRTQRRLHYLLPRMHYC